MRRRSGSWLSVAVWAIVILVATSVPVTEMAHRLPVPWLDKAVHAALYGVLGWLVGTALSVSGRRNRWTFAVALVAIATFAGIDELHQRWLPGRVPMTSDWLADIIGAAIGLVAGMAILRRAVPEAADEV